MTKVSIELPLNWDPVRGPVVNDQQRVNGQNDLSKGYFGSSGEGNPLLSRKHRKEGCRALARRTVPRTQNIPTISHISTCDTLKDKPI
jgi:hypothetical protein